MLHGLVLLVLHVHLHGLHLVHHDHHRILLVLRPFRHRVRHGHRQILLVLHHGLHRGLRHLVRQIHHDLLIRRKPFYVKPFVSLLC